MDHVPSPTSFFDFVQHVTTSLHAYLAPLLIRLAQIASMASPVDSMAPLDLAGRSNRRMVHLKTKEECRLGNETIQVWTVELPSKHAEGILRYAHPPSCLSPCPASRQLTPSAESPNSMCRTRTASTCNTSGASPSPSSCPPILLAARTRSRKCTWFLVRGSPQHTPLHKPRPHPPGSIPSP